MKHELDVFRSHGAFTVRVDAKEEVRRKRGKLVSGNDTTETELDNIKDWDYVFDNNGSYEDLQNNIPELIKAIEEKLGRLY